MHVSGVSLDLNWILQFVLTAFLVVVGLLRIVRNTASRYFEVDANFEPVAADTTSSAVVSGCRPTPMPGIAGIAHVCALCREPARSLCSGCKDVRYCSQACQKTHWTSGHKKKCLELRSTGKEIEGSAAAISGRSFGHGGIALIPVGGISKTHSGISKTHKQPQKFLFPYDEFVKLFNWDKPGFLPCGLLNCGNSCFANVVLQCLAFTRPLVAYLLEKGHRKECRRNDWCFLCEFQTYVETARQSPQPFSPLSILSRLPNIGGNFGYGKQEDAHEFMRFAIDKMQSACLDEFGGEKAIHFSAQETTLIQHIFGGHLQSQVICSECNNISNQYENMMDLTVEIQGDAASLEECLDQFTVRETLHGENKYKCDGCNDYVKASKCLTVRCAPNVLTIALKRFQSGRFGKLNKRVSFPETLDLTSYMSELGDGTDVYKLYAVVVHLDILNASYFGHYICYVKDFGGTWFRTDDDKVRIADLEEVLTQGAYMLLYSRMSARPSSLVTTEPSKKENHIAEMAQEVAPGLQQPLECAKTAKCGNLSSRSGLLPSSDLDVKVSSCEEMDSDVLLKERAEYMDVDNLDSGSLHSKRIELDGDPNCSMEEIASPIDLAPRADPRSVSSEKTPSSDAESLTGELPFSTANQGDCRLAEGVSLCSTENIVPNQVLVLKNGEASHDVPMAALGSSEKEALFKSLSLPPLKKVKSGERAEYMDLDDAESGSLRSKHKEVDGDPNFNMEEIASPINHDHWVDPGSVPLEKISSSGAENLTGELPSLSNANQGCQLEKGVSLYSSTKKFVPNQDPTLGNGKISHNAPIVTASSSENETPVKKVPFSSLKKDKSGEILPMAGMGVEDKVKSFGEINASSGVKLKPIFSPGFLSRHPRNGLVKRNGNATVGHDSCVSRLLHPDDVNLEVSRCEVDSEDKREAPYYADVDKPGSGSGLVSLDKITSPGGKDMICEPAPDVGIEDPVETLGGRNLSGKKLKPLLSPGFLANHPRKNALKRRGSAAVDLDARAHVLKVTDCNGFARPSCNHKISDEKEERKEHSDCKENELVGVDLVHSAAKEPKKICSDCNKNDMAGVNFIKSANLCNVVNGCNCDSLRVSSDEHLIHNGASSHEAAAANGNMTGGSNWKTD